MRLLHTRTKELRWFWEGERPRYAILSHTWLSTSGEVSFQELEAVLKTPNHPSTDSVELKPGYRKIQDFCDAADKLGFDWGWVDTCCIDKTSSAELSEAINSMYRWYGQSALCMAYLSDVSANDTDLSAHNSPFRKSKWFTRGWTLQELIAPPVLLFFSDTWTCLGDRLTLAPFIEDVCGVPSALSFGRKPIDYSIAQRMSWAAMRVTTRKEDMAYCLLGLFDITMSLIYGEADKAFQRLQKKIIKESEDQTIFAWGFCLPDQIILSPSGSPYLTPILAKSPLLFEGCGDIMPYSGPHERYFANREFEVTRGGIRNNLRYIYDLPSIYGTRVLVILPCKRLNTNKLIGIRLYIDATDLPIWLHSTLNNQDDIMILNRIKACKLVQISPQLLREFRLDTYLSINVPPSDYHPFPNDLNGLITSPNGTVIVSGSKRLRMTALYCGKWSVVAFDENHVAVHQYPAVSNSKETFMAMFACLLATSTNADDTSRPFYMMIDYEYDNRHLLKDISSLSSIGVRPSWEPRCLFAPTVPGDEELNIEKLRALNWVYTLDHFGTSISVNKGPIHLRGDIFIFFITVHGERLQHPQTTLFRLIESNRLRDGHRIKRIIRSLSSYPPFWFVITGWSLLFLAAYGMIAGVKPLTILGIVYGTINLAKGFPARHRRRTSIWIRLLLVVDVLLPLAFFLTFFRF